MSSTRRDTRGGIGAHGSMHQNMSNQKRQHHDEPTHNAPRHYKHPDLTNITAEIPRKSFTTRCRLFVGNLPNEMKEEDCRKLFAEFGEIGECYMSGKGFGFVRLVCTICIYCL